MPQVSMIARDAIKSSLSQKTIDRAVKVLQSELEYGDRLKLGMSLDVNKLKLKDAKHGLIKFKAEVDSFTVLGDDVTYTLKGVINIAKEKAKWATKKLFVWME